MNYLLPLLIVAIHPEAPIESRYPEATAVFSCTFDASWDTNFDEWPDNWTRRQGPGFPSYVKMALAKEAGPPSRNCLRIDLNGGGAVAFSPPIAVSSRYSYVLEGQLKTEGLDHDEAFLSLTLLNGKRQRLETYYSKRARDLHEWTKFRLGPISANRSDARMAVIGLHLEPGQKADLHGSAMFDDIWLGRLPRMSLVVNSPYHLFTDAGQVAVTCTASGFMDGDPLVALVLEDAVGQKIAEVQPPLEIQKSESEAEISLDGPVEKQPPVGMATWKPPIPGPGFYRVRGLMKGNEGMVQRQVVVLAVLDESRPPRSGEFGWSLPRGAHPMGLPELAWLASQAGINWVKFPVWYAAESGDDEVAQLITFNERLMSQGISMVGMLSRPPRKIREQFEHPESVPAAEIFSSSEDVWYPSVELVMMRLATLVRWWQLGTDTDTSFVDYPNLTEKISQIKACLDRIGQNVNLGFGWNWMVQLPRSTKQPPPWQFLNLSCGPPLTDQELESYLAVTQQSGLKRWVVLEPLPEKQYPMQTRVCDLVRRMMAAKIHGAEGVFIPDPFDANCGLMNEDGTPGELLLPWRTTALMLSGAGYAGTMELPCGSPNQVFIQKGSAVMAVWNRERVREVVHFGDDVRQVDLWSGEHAPQQQDHRQVIDVGPVPTFVTGLELPLLKWRQACSMAKDRIPSVFGQRHENNLLVKNTFDVGVSGELKLVMPEVWSVRPNRVDFHLAAGETLRVPFELTLPFDATSGQHRVRVDFTLHADKAYRFSAYFTIGVGLGDVYVECITQLNSNGELEVEQQFHNETSKPVSFRCELFVPDRKRLKTDVLDLQRGSVARTFRLSDGQKLVGKTLWLRAEEIGGSRVLNYRFVAQP